MMRCAGLTLIELLVSIFLGMILLAMASTALLQVTRIAKRDTALRQAHNEIAMISRLLERRLGSTYHASQMRFEADAGADGWGSGDETLTLIWMSTLRSLDERYMNTDTEYPRSLVWNLLRWEGDGKGGGTLSYGMSSQQRSKSVGKSVFKTNPQWRRDRRRDLNDNDGRWVPGMTGAILDKIELVGDYDDLEDQILPIHSISTRMVDVVFEWVDAAGTAVRCDPEQGISGSSVLGTDFSNETIHVIDGVFLDGRAHVAAGGTRLSLAERPSIIRIGCTLIPASNLDVDEEKEPRVPFTFAFSTTPHLPYLP